MVFWFQVVLVLMPAWHGSAGPADSIIQICDKMMQTVDGDVNQELVLRCKTLLTKWKADLKLSGTETGASVERLQSGAVKSNVDLAVNGSIRAHQVRAENLLVFGDVRSSIIMGKTVTSSLVTADVLETPLIRSPTGTITIDGNLRLTGESGSPSAAGKPISFLSTNEIVVNGKKQWAQWAHDHFQNTAEGWSHNQISSCARGEQSTASDRFLGGHCNFANTNVSKTYRNLPPHTHLRLSARFHFLDQWRGETGFALVDQHYVWTESCGDPDGDDSSSGVDMCGGAAADRKFSSPVHAVVEHNRPNATIVFGSTLDDHPCRHSFGVDDVIVEVL